MGRALCSGLFSNVARKAPSGRGFRTMEGHGTHVFMHPSSVVRLHRVVVKSYLVVIRVKYALVYPQFDHS